MYLWLSLLLLIKNQVFSNTSTGRDTTYFFKCNTQYFKYYLDDVISGQVPIVVLIFLDLNITHCHNIYNFNR